MTFGLVSCCWFFLKMVSSSHLCFIEFNSCTCSNLHFSVLARVRAGSRARRIRKLSQTKKKRERLSSLSCSDSQSDNVCPWLDVSSVVCSPCCCGHQKCCPLLLRIDNAFALLRALRARAATRKLDMWDIDDGCFACSRKL